MDKNLLREYVIRKQVRELLSADELARIELAGAANDMADGDEYLSLDHVSLGVQRAAASAPPRGSVVTRAAVGARTWDQILGLLSSSGGR